MITEIDIEPTWTDIDLDLMLGIVMIIGGTNTGKTTFARYLFTRLQKMGRKIAYLDGDPGQSTFGPPTTMTLTFDSEERENKVTWRSFVGSTSPKGHMLQTVVGAKKLSEIAQSQGAEIILYDTTGLIDPDQGGTALKFAKLDLLHPSSVFAIQRGNELNPLISPLKQKQQLNIHVLDPSKSIRYRDQNERRRYRSRKYKEYFSGKSEIVINWTEFPVFPASRFAVNRLMAFENEHGFVEALGIITNISRSQHQLTIKCPDISLKSVGAIRLGDILVSPTSYEDKFI